MTETKRKEILKSNRPLPPPSQIGKGRRGVGRFWGEEKEVDRDKIQCHRKVGESLNPPRRILKQAEGKREGGGREEREASSPHLNLLNGSKEPGGNLLFSARGFGNKGGGFTFKFSTRLEPPSSSSSSSSSSFCFCSSLVPSQGLGGDRSVK